MKMAVITSGFLPVPATMGGAVENLLVNLLNINEKEKNINFEVFSIYNESAIEESKKYKYTTFKFIKINKLITLLDNVIFIFAKKILKKCNAHSYRYIFQRLYFLNKCSILLKNSNYDKVLLENHPTQYLALKWRKNYIKYNNKIFYHCHNELFSTYGCYDIIATTKKFICVSNFRKNTVMNFLNLRDDSQFSVLKNAIDSSVITKKASYDELKKLKEKYDISAEDRVIIYSGRIVPGKGIKEILLSLKNVKYKNYKLLLLGSSLNNLSVKTNFESEILSLIDDDIKQKIIFTGFINYNDLYQYYSLADFSVLPSIMEDSAPLTIVESLCCGLPIITTDSGGIPEYVTKKSAIILKRDENIVDNLSSSIDLLLNDSALVKRMSKEAIKASNDFSLDQFYFNFLSQVGE